MKRGSYLITDLYVKPTDTHQYLHATSSHVYYSKKYVPLYSNLTLEAHFYDKRCNELESWLQNCSYSDKMVRNQILRAGKFKRMDLLNKQNSNSKEDLLVFNITYHPKLSKLKSICSDIHLL